MLHARVSGMQGAQFSAYKGRKGCWPGTSPGATAQRSPLAQPTPPVPLRWAWWPHDSIHSHMTRSEWCSHRMSCPCRQLPAGRHQLTGCHTPISSSPAELQQGAHPMGCRQEGGKAGETVPATPLPVPGTLGRSLSTPCDVCNSWHPSHQGAGQACREEASMTLIKEVTSECGCARHTQQCLLHCALRKHYESHVGQQMEAACPGPQRVLAAAATSSSPAPQASLHTQALAGRKRHVLLLMQV